MKKISFSIRTKLNLLLIVIIFAISILFAILVLSYIRINRISSLNQDLSDLSSEYLQLRKHEQQFLLYSSEDPTFFKTGKNTHFRRFEASISNISDYIDLVISNNLIDNLEVEENTKELNDAILNYGLVFDEIVNKTYERGSSETGYIGEVNRNFEYAYNNVNNLQYKYFMDDISTSVKNFIIEKDINHYYTFLEKFSSINYFLNSNFGLISSNENVNEQDTITYLVEESSSETFYKEIIKSLNDYKRNFIALVTIEQEIGLTSEDGLKGEMNSEITIIENQLDYLNTLISEKYISYKKNAVSLAIVSVILLLILITAIILILTYSIINPLKLIKDYINPLRKGILPQELLKLENDNEISEMSRDLNHLISGLKHTTEFANKIGEGIFDTEYNPLSDSDELGNSLIMMRKNLQETQKEQEKRKKEDDIRQWANEGITLFSEIMRQRTKNINELSSNVIKNLVNFLEANQGGVFLYNDSKKDDIHLELVASYAYNLDRKKHKKIYMGEGLVGTCAIEKAPIYMTDIPNDYISITSGLGGANPTSILIVPLKVEEQILGVIEIASFKKFEKHQIEFTEKVSETIASTLSIAKINQRTEELLAQSQQQAEEMAAQEEEMRQNLEELMATQEESLRKETEMQSLLNAINSAALVLELDLKGKIMSANHSVLTLFQMQEELLVGKIYAEFDLSETNQLENAEFWNKIKNGETIQLTRKINVNLNEFWLSEVFTPILDADGFTYKVLCIANDITNSKKQEDNLALYTEQLSAQEETLRKNLEELSKTQDLLKLEQEQLEKSNLKLIENEQNLIKALEKSKAQEMQLQKDHATSLENENKLKENLKKAQEQEQLLNNKINEYIQKISDLEDRLKR